MPLELSFFTDLSSDELKYGKRVALRYIYRGGKVAKKKSLVPLLNASLKAASTNNSAAPLCVLAACVDQ